MYGLYWCPHCIEQKEMFGKAFQYVPYVECAIKGSHDLAPACAAAGVKLFPSWQFGSESADRGSLSSARVERVRLGAVCRECDRRSTRRAERNLHSANNRVLYVAIAFLAVAGMPGVGGLAGAALCEVGDGVLRRR